MRGGVQQDWFGLVWLKPLWGWSRTDSPPRVRRRSILDWWILFFRLAGLRRSGAVPSALWPVCLQVVSRTSTSWLSPGRVSCVWRGECAGGAQAASQRQLCLSVVLCPRDNLLQPPFPSDKAKKELACFGVNEGGTDQSRTSSTLSAARHELITCFTVGGSRASGHALVSRSSPGPQEFLPGEVVGGAPDLRKMLTSFSLGVDQVLISSSPGASLRCLVRA